MKQFLTIYRQDYVPLKIKKLPKKITTSEFKNPINEGFREYLTIKETPEFEKQLVDEYTEKIKAEKPKIGELYFSKPLDRAVIRNYQLNDLRTVYQNDYEDVEIFAKFLEEENKKKSFRLPSDWNLPQTTQTAGYRDPAMLNPNVYSSPKIEKTPDNLVPNDEIRKLLKTVTGETDYMAEIGKTGEKIIIEEMLGKRFRSKCNQ